MRSELLIGTDAGSPGRVVRSASAPMTRAKTLAVPAGRLTRARATLQASALVLLMVLVSLVMWVAMPVGWIYVAAQLTPPAASSFSVLGAIVTAIALSAVPLVRLLGSIDRAYCRATSRLVPQLRHGWLRSLSDCRGSTRPSSPLETITVLTTLLAWVALAVWVVFFADGLGVYGE